MKQLLILCLSLSLFIACKDKKDTRRDDTKTTTEKDDYRNTDEKNNNNNASENRNDANNESEGWSKSDVKKFLTDCEGSATPNVGAARAAEYCDCMLKRMEKIYSSLPDAERKMANITKAEIDEFAAPCNR